MGRGNGRRKRNKAKAAPKDANGNAKDSDARPPTDSTTRTTGEAKLLNPANGVSNYVEGNDLDSVKARASGQSGGVSEFDFGKLSISDEKENFPRMTTTNVREHLHDDGYHGLEAIDRACRILYPYNESHPVITSPAVKIWLGGTMPLDYVKIFYNEGDPSEGIVSHWHFISYGLSDLHGDGRVHVPTGRGYPSGFGFELVFRLKREEGETEPPPWPVKILNELAAYCFNSGTRLHEFDHIPWNHSLNTSATAVDTEEDMSHIRHMVLVEDPKILDLDTPNGTVQFLQIVGIVEEELHYSRTWTTCGVVDHLLDHPRVGPLLITDMQRKTSIFDFKPELRRNLIARIEQDGSNLTNITAHIYWFDVKRKMVGTRDNINDEFIDHIFTNDPEILENFIDIESVNIHIDPIAAEVLPVMVKGRMKKGVTFVFDSPACVMSRMRQSIYFIPHSFKGPGNVLVSKETPMKGEGGFLQIYCSKELIDEMDEKFAAIKHARKRKSKVPLHIVFSHLSLIVTVQPNYLWVAEQHSKDKKLSQSAAPKEGKL